MHGARLRRQDGFIREVLWLFLGIAVLAVVLLDGMALFGAHQAVADDAQTAATAATNEYAQTVSVPMARIAAQEYLAKSGDTMISFSMSGTTDGTVQATVAAEKHAKTYVFKYLRYAGLKKWVAKMTNPTATSHSEGS